MLIAFLCRISLWWGFLCDFVVGTLWWFLSPPLLGHVHACSLFCIYLHVRLRVHFPTTFPTTIVLYVAPQVPTTFHYTIVFYVYWRSVGFLSIFVGNRPDFKVHLQRVYDSSHLIYPMISKMSLWPHNYCYDHTTCLTPHIIGIIFSLENASA